MKIKVVTIGQKMPKWVQEGYQEYAKRLPKDIGFELIELPMAKRGKSGSTAQWIAQEGDAMMALIQPDHWVIALDERGKNWTTTQLSEQLSNWQLNGRDVILLIGGPDGLSAACKARANQLWSLSGLTLPHPMVRILLTETLYRAWTLLSGHPYHRS